MTRSQRQRIVEQIAGVARARRLQPGEFTVRHNVPDVESHVSLCPRRRPRRRRRRGCLDPHSNHQIPQPYTSLGDDRYLNRLVYSHHID